MSGRHPFPFEGRVAIVTGAASGLGLAIARRLHADGCAVLAADLNAAALGAMTLDDGGPGRLQIAVADIGREAEARGLVPACVAAFGQVDILVNCAGIARLSGFVDQPLDDWNRILNVNLTGALVCAQAAAQAMIARGQGGRIINIASISGLQAGSGRVAYGTSKAALMQLTRQMALDLGPHGITANAVAPGPIDTPMVIAHHSADTRRSFTSRIPLGRYGLPDEVAGAVAFLAGDDAAYISGHTLCVDGGFSSTGVVAGDL